MSSLQPSYGSETSLTWSGAIASSVTAARQSDAIDNTSTLADDLIVGVSIVFPNSAPANDKTVYLFAGGWMGSTLGWEGSPALSGTDGAITLDADFTANATALHLARSCFMVQNKTRVFLIPSVAAVFGGTLPPKVAFVAVNYSGQTLTTFTATYRTVTYTIT